MRGNSPFFRVLPRPDNLCCVLWGRWAQLSGSRSASGQAAGPR